MFRINTNHTKTTRLGVFSALLAGSALILTAESSIGQESAPAAGQTAVASRKSVKEAPIVAEGLTADGQLKLMVNKSAVLTTRVPYKRVSMGQPEVADVNPIGPSNILITAKKQGTTQLIVWDDADRSQVLDVIVQTDLKALQDQLTVMFPGSKIEVTCVNGSIILNGRVSSTLVADQAAQITAPYVASGKVLNLLEVSGGQQVMLQVRLAEVSKSAIDNLGVNWGFTDGTTVFGSNVGQVSPLGLVGDNSILAVRDPNSSVTLFGKGSVGNTSFAYFIAALRQNNLLRVLAEPNLIAISGQEASFLAGGEFPIPVPQSSAGNSGSSAITIEYREYGVKLNFLPVVLGDGKIRLKCSPEVSDLDFTTAVHFSGFVVPGLTSRKVSTTIELNDGQSFAIAGLLNNSVSATKDVTPLLGDLPVIGALFRSVRYQKKETELVVLVTPRVIGAMHPGQVPQLPGEKWRDPSEAELFLNQDLGGPVNDAKRMPTTAPTYHGDHGFTPPETKQK